MSGNVLAFDECDDSDMDRGIRTARLVEDFLRAQAQSLRAHGFDSEAIDTGLLALAAERLLSHADAVGTAAWLRALAAVIDNSAGGNC